MRYESRDIVGVAGFSIASGLVFIIASYSATFILAILGPIGVATMCGIWFIGATLTGYIIRKPGAALLGELIGAHVELLLGSPYSIFLTYYGFSQGIMSEIVFTLRKYRRWDYTTMALAGAAPALAAFPIDYYIVPQYQYAQIPSLEIQAILFLLYLISGAVFGGIMIKWLVDRAVRAGALRGWPVAKAN
ncbi:MAG: ECF transporter S component [Candidatus Bathyarchaeia archaeon]